MTFPAIKCSWFPFVLERWSSCKYYCLRITLCSLLQLRWGVSQQSCCRGDTLSIAPKQLSAELVCWYFAELMYGYNHKQSQSLKTWNLGWIWLQYVVFCDMKPVYHHLPHCSGHRNPRIMMFDDFTYSVIMFIILYVHLKFFHGVYGLQKE